MDEWYIAYDRLGYGCKIEFPQKLDVYGQLRFLVVVVMSNQKYLCNFS